jgi:hypothetical protein
MSRPAAGERMARVLDPDGTSCASRFDHPVFYLGDLDPAIGIALPDFEAAP